MSQQLPRYTPYDGSATPFAIGLKPLDLADWIEIDRHYRRYLECKDRLIAERPADVFVAETGADDAQAEALELIVDHLIRGYATIFPGRDQWDFLAERLARFETGSGEPRLQIAARFVQEDLILMRKGANGWRLVAGSLCFPSSWTLTEKFARPLHEIHAPVPGFGGGTRNADLIERMFDRLQGQAVQRMNWSLQADDELYLPRSEHVSPLTDDDCARQFSDDASIASAFIRVERQTLRKLPRSGDILFTIRIYLDPLATLARHPDRAAIARSLAGQLGALDEAQSAYKGLTDGRDRLIAALETMAETSLL